MTEYEPTEYDQQVSGASTEIVTAYGIIPNASDSAVGQIHATIAVAQATLALAEQQRIANLVAMAAYNHAEIERRMHLAVPVTKTEKRRHVELVDLAREALGLPPMLETQEAPPVDKPTALDLAGEQQRIAIEKRRIGDVHEFDTPEDLAYRVEYLTAVIADPSEDAGVTDYANQELAEYERLAGPVQPGDGVYECSTCGATFDDDHYADAGQHEADNPSHAPTLRHRKRGE